MSFRVRVCVCARACVCLSVPVYVSVCSVRVSLSQVFSSMQLTVRAFSDLCRTEHTLHLVNS